MEATLTGVKVFGIAAKRYGARIKSHCPNESARITAILWMMSLRSKASLLNSMLLPMMLEIVLKKSYMPMEKFSPWYIYG